MKAVSLIICIVCCYQALAKKPQDHGDFMPKIDIQGVNTFTPNNKPGFEPENMMNIKLKSMNALDMHNNIEQFREGLPLLVKNLRKDVLSLKDGDFDTSKDLVNAFLVVVREADTSLLDLYSLESCVSSYNDIIAKNPQVERQAITLEDFSMLNHDEKVDEITKLFGDLLFDLENARMPQDDL